MTALLVGYCGDAIPVTHLEWVHKDRKWWLVLWHEDMPVELGPGKTKRRVLEKWGITIEEPSDAD